MSKDSEGLKTDWVSPHGGSGHFGTIGEALRGLVVEISHEPRPGMLGVVFRGS